MIDEIVATTQRNKTMPERTPRTKKEKQNAVHTVMHEFKHGELHSGSKHGPKVKGRKQAVAIALSEAGMSNKSAKQPHPKTNPGAYDSSPHSGADRAKPAEKLRGPQQHARARPRRRQPAYGTYAPLTPVERTRLRPQRRAALGCAAFERR